MRQCLKCQRNLADEEFYVRTDGFPRRTCKSCSGAEATQRKRNLRASDPEGYLRRLRRRVVKPLTDEAKARYAASRKATLAAVPEEERKARNRARYLGENAERRAERDKAYRNKPENKARIAAQKKANRKPWRNSVRDRAVYGLEETDYARLEAVQGYVCAICEQPERTKHNLTGEVRRLSVDHCHKFQYVRGLLCGACNRGLGYFRDSPEALRRAADYLEAPPKLTQGIESFLTGDSLVTFRELVETARQNFLAAGGVDAPIEGPSETHGFDPKDLH